MSLLDRWRRRPSDQQQEQPQPPPPTLRVLRASGQRIDLSARDVGMRIAATRQQWQTDAWDYYGRIGELAYALRLLSQSVTKVRFYAAELRPYPDVPVELTGKDHDIDQRLADEAVEQLARLPLDDDGVDSFLATLCRNLSVAGEAWVHGQREDDSGADGETWTVRSISEIVARGSEVYLSEIPTNTTLGQRRIDPDAEELLRCWVRHPRWGQLADSPLSSTMDTLEGIVLDGREARAASQSRIAANGVLLVPDTLSFVKTREESEALEEESVRDDDFMGDLTEGMTAPIRNEGHAGAVVPLVIRGSAEDLKEVRHLKLDRADPEKLTERVNAGVARMLRSLDIQPEQVEGVAQSNHWTGWLLESKDIRQQIEPWSATIAGCLTKAFLRPALLALGHDPDQVRRIAVWRDITGLVENPDRSQDAKDAWDRDSISDAALRDALGFDDDDAPEPTEHLARLLAKGRITPEAVPLIAALEGMDMQTPALRQALAISTGLAAKPAPGARPLALPSGSPKANATPAQPGQLTPDQPTPQPGTDVVVSSANVDLPPGWSVNTDVARELAEIDAALAERITTAADAAIARAIERAGGRARSAVRAAARRDAALAAAIDGTDAVLIPHRVGRDVLLAAISLTDLLSDAFTRLRGQVFGWLDSAAGQVAGVVLRLLGLGRNTTAGRRVHDAVTTRLAVHQDSAWLALSAALDDAAQRAMFRADPLNPERSGRGEEPDTLIDPAEVSRVLAVAGGGNPDHPTEGGLATGLTARGVLTDEGAVLLGWEWAYHPGRPRNTFPPHALLDGARFATWTDPKLETTAETAWLGTHMHPQDHRGCLCGSRPLWAVPEFDDDIVSRRIREASTSEHARATARIAAEDAAAGRVGTSVQNEVEVRQRIAADVAQLRQHYIEGVKL